MEDNNPSTLILLTYKGKALLMHKKNSVIDEVKHPWSFIGGIKGQRETDEKSLLRHVEKETGIKIDKIEFVSDFCYHARLTDDNVNRIKRGENQLLDFYTLKELKKLFLSKFTRQFVSKHSSLIFNS